MSLSRCWFCVVALLVTAMAAGGCNRRGALPKLSFNASRAADDAIAQYDANHDGALAGDELAACPGIKDSLANFDKNGDGRVDAGELRDRFQVWLDSPTRLVKVLCVVNLDGQPLSNAAVTLTPEKFLGDAVLPGEGTTGPNGMAAISIDTEEAAPGMPQLTGMRLGLYRVSVSHPTTKVPSKYNTNTTLGCEISPSVSGAPLTFSITTR